MDEVTGASNDPGPPPGATGPGSSDRYGAVAAVRTFLIADVRGYTRFTQEHGDEEAGRLAAAFAALARETIVASGGELIELRGDEALSAFGSARQAVRAAVELQTRFRQRGGEGATFPLSIGIGLDAGEAVPIEGGYRGGALNTAARLCSLAAPGQILATETVVSLARRLEGIRFVERRPVRLKGLEKPVRPIEILPEAGFPPLPAVASPRLRWASKPRLTVALIAVLLVVGAIAFGLLRSGGSPARTLESNSIGAIDAEGVNIAAQLKLAGAPSAVTTGAGNVWVASQRAGTVSRIDADLRTVETLSIGGSPGGVAYGAGSIWVTNSDARKLIQVDPSTLKRVQTFEVGNGPGAVAVGRDAVWVANTIDGTLSRISLGEGRVTTIPVGPSPVGIAVAPGAVWVTIAGDNTVVRIDPISRMIVQAISVGNDPTDLSAGAGGVWVANNEDGTVSHIDPATNSVTATTRTGADPSAVAVGAGAIWVANGGDGTISRLDPRTGQPTKTLVLGNSPNALTLTNDKVFATTLSSTASHRGGVLRIESEASYCRCADPAHWAEAGNLTDVLVPQLVYDGLVAYRRVGGVAGAKLVPDLAVRLPAPNDMGRTYTFQLRRGLRFSDGKPVLASDFRYSLERQLSIGGAFGPYEGVVGAASCTGRHARLCDLSSGIEVDDRSRTITIHLARADPEFLYKLALPLASVVPSGTPLRPARGKPIPTVGPYRVALIDDREIRLVRNTFFRVWAADARPDGYPAEIRFQLGNTASAGVKAVEKGEDDWAFLLDPSLKSQQVRGVLTRDAGSIESDPGPSTDWWFLNTRAPPFDDVRVRRALNYAVDRGTLAGLVVPGSARLTCEILPARFPGYRPYCPYTPNPNPAGTWARPDLAKARALIAASNTRGMRIQIATFGSDVSLGVARYFLTLLNRLGFRTTLRVFPDLGQYLGHVADSRNRAQIGPAGWTADSLVASNFLQLFTCASFIRNSPANLNFSAYCDPRLDAKIKRASALQASDPERADSLWAEVDRALVDRAVAVPYANRRNEVLLSKRVGNYQDHPLWGTLFDQLWVK